VTNSTFATGSFSGKTITSSNSAIAVVHYEYLTNDRAHNGGYNNGGYGDAVASVVPVAPVPIVYGSPVYGSEPNGYGNVPDGNGSKSSVYTSGPSTT
jgi:hypothetical protein